MEKFYLIGGFILLLTGFIILGCRKAKTVAERKGPSFVSTVIHPEWSRNAVVYEVNIRQYTSAGTFNAFSDHLPRLQRLGIDILWLMPIHPIGSINRKGPLGSYYSVMDYRDVNPEHGSLQEFKNLLARAHELGFHVILDWVPNHTSWDHAWTRDHPEFYVKNEEGSFIPPIGTDWTDVIQLDWSNPGMQDAMLDDLKFWVALGVDGYRVDHPHKTPPEFWERARTELDAIRPVLMLAENEEQTVFMEKGFDMNYAWELHHLKNEVAQGKKNVKHLRRYFAREDSVYPPNVYRMRFLTNHDENSWQGTIDERMGEAHRVMAVFMFTMPGVPLLYSGQEACLDKRLEFFSRDPIEWKECDMTQFYRELIRIKKENTALWNGEFGGSMREIKTSRPGKVLAYAREKEGNVVISILNLSNRSVRIKPDLSDLEGDYLDPPEGRKAYPATGGFT